MATMAAEPVFVDTNVLVYGVRRLLTNNTDDFVRFAAFIDVLPLVQPPAPALPPSA